MHNVSKNSKSTWITRLASVPLVHTAIRVLKVQQIAARVFAVVPLKRRLKASGLPYRVRFLESLLVADEIFEREIYGRALEGKEIRTFVDIGSNVGYFPLYIAERTGRKDVRGLLVDGNEEMVAEAQWHIENAGLSGTRVLHGVAGYPRGVEEATFYVNASNIASSAQPELNPNVPAKGESRAVHVKTVDVFEEWKSMAGDARIDLLKVDVEGFECELLRNSPEVLALTDRLVLEWHKWVTSQQEVEAILFEHGFVRRCFISEDEDAGVAVYDRRPN